MGDLHLHFSVAETPGVTASLALLCRRSMPGAPGLAGTWHQGQPHPAGAQGVGCPLSSQRRGPGWVPGSEGGGRHAVVFGPHSAFCTHMLPLSETFLQYVAPNFRHPCTLVYPTPADHSGNLRGTAAVCPEPSPAPNRVPELGFNSS